MKKINDIKESISVNLLILKLKKRAQKLGISIDFMEQLACHKNYSNEKEIINVIKKSKNKEIFQQNIINFINKNPNCIYNKSLIIGNFIGRYNYYKYSSHNSSLQFIDNFNINNKDLVIKKLKDKFFDYVMNDNKVKNLFYTSNNGIRNFNYEIDKEEVNKIFNNFIDGNIGDIKNDKEKYRAVGEYIFQILNNYEINDIINNFDFISYDLYTNHNEPLETRRDKFLKHSNLSNNQLNMINNIESLKIRLKKINTPDSKELLNRLNNIENYYECIDELNDIYMEYELLLRNDLLNHLFVPSEQVTVIDDFRNLRPQLIHCFFRGTNKFEDNLKEKIKQTIISERIDGNKSPELTEQEQERFNKKCQLLKEEINQTKVNYSFDSSVATYSDNMGFNFYISDTSNQISATLYSEKYFNDCVQQMLGIGFNSEGLLPEAIVLSSRNYLTTNKGLNNIEYTIGNEFNLFSTPYNELKENDGNSEIVMFRRNLDYDTKASYVFVAYDSEYSSDYEELLAEARKLSLDNNMKLVIYDLCKIRKSYINYNSNLASEVQDNKKIK